MHDNPDRGLILGGYDRNTMRNDEDQRERERLAREAAERHGGWYAAMKWALGPRDKDALENLRARPHAPEELSPTEGSAGWDRLVDAVMEKFDVPEDYAQRVVGTVIGALREEA